MRLGHIVPAPNPVLRAFNLTWQAAPKTIRELLDADHHANHGLVLFLQ
jgi:hypothetical protein